MLASVAAAAHNLCRQTRYQRTPTDTEAALIKLKPIRRPRPADVTAVLVAMLRDEGYEDLAREVMRRAQPVDYTRMMQ